MNVELPIVLHTNQKIINDSQALYKVIKAGKRFGKTKWSIFALTQAAGQKPGGVFWLIAPTYRQAKNIAWREFKALIPMKYIKRMVENELLIELVNGASIQLIGADNEDSLRGPKLDGVIFDEAAYINKYIFNNIIRGQLLGSNGQKPGFAYFISSPNFKGVNWYTDFFLEAMRKKSMGSLEWEAWHFTIYDNPTLTREQIDEIRNDSTDDEWNVEYLANESAHAGQIYSEFNYQKHVMECVQSGVMARAIDWGIDHPTVCLFAHIDNDKKQVYIEDEYVQSGYTIEESVEVIRKKTQGKEVEWTVCDPSLNKRNSQTGRTDKQEFDRLGVFCIPGDNNNRGYNITKMFFKKDMIRIHPRCKNLIKELKTVQWADKTGEDCVDSLRYLCVRIHDLVFKWKDEAPKEEVKHVPEGEFNIYDKLLFPKRIAMSSVKEQVRSY